MPETAVRQPHLRRARFAACFVAALAVAFVVGAPANGARNGNRDIVPSPSGVGVLDSTQTSISLTWLPPGHADAGVVGYDLYVNLTLVDRVMLADRALWRPYTFTGLACGTAYNLGIDALDADGNKSRPVSVVASTDACSNPAPSPADGQAPSTPSGVTATFVSHATVALSWIRSSDNVGVVGYDVYSNGSFMGTTPSPGFTVDNLTCGSTYTFAIDAYDATGNRSGRGSVSASTGACLGASTPPPPPPAQPPAPEPPPPTTTPTTTTRHTDGTPPDLLPPATPLAFGVQAAGPTSVSLGWSESWDNVGVTGYDVYANGTRVGTTNSTSFTVYGLSCATTYTFAVDAVDAAGNQSLRAQASASTASCTAGAASSDIFVSPAGSDANGCTQAQPCASFARAYALALPGDTVQIAAGNYPSQIIPFDPAKAGGRVVFAPAPGASVRVAMIDFGQDQFGIRGPHGVVVRDMEVTYLRAWNGSDDLVFQNVSGRHFDVFNSSNVSVLGGSYGPCQAPADDPSCVIRIAASSNVLVSGVSIHGITSTDLANYHVDGMFIRGSTGVVVRDSKFWGNMITNIRIQDQPGFVDQNITLENNWFDASLQGDGSSRRWDAIDVDNPVSGLVVRNNSFAVDAGLQLTGTFSNARVVGNVMRYGGNCEAGVTYTSNVFMPFSAYGMQTGCGPSDTKVTTFGYVNAATLDFHLGDASPAIGAGAVGDCPADDIDGDSRSGRCDAGADQR